jgi:hypothetical protein
MARSSSPKHQCDRILHLMEIFLRGTGIQGRNRYNMNNHRHVHILQSLASYESYRTKINLVKGRRRGRIEKRVSSQEAGKNKAMARMKHTMRKGKPLGEGNPEISRKMTRIENVAREGARMYQTSFPHKGKELVESWEEEIKVEQGGKEMDKIAQKVDWIRDTGATRTKEILYHRTLEMAWVTKMLIGKVKADQDETRKEDQQEMKSMREEI